MKSYSLSNVFGINKDEGIASICSANKFVIESTLKHAKENNSKALIESTSNQVDQFGGYTGLTPKMFYDYVTSIAAEMDFSLENLILGGDHLGPNVWKKENSNLAMQNAFEQVDAYVTAGYKKIHLDTSYPLRDDKAVDGKIPTELITERAAQLCLASEKAYEKLNNSSAKPVYVIGTDVPIPGGAIDGDEEIEITTHEELEETIELSKNAFIAKGLEDAWERVIAVVIQPGVEFSDSKVLSYDRSKNKKIIETINNYENLCLEAHSTDYQSQLHLSQMVEDGFSILKVGPWLTFALREALYAFSYIESEMIKYRLDLIPSNMREFLDKTMFENQSYWSGHYNGDDNTKYLARNYSYSDRIRYYWADKSIINSVNKLIENLTNLKIPESLISQFLPNQYREIRDSKIENNPNSLIMSKIGEVLSIYNSATGGLCEK